MTGHDRKISVIGLGYVGLPIAVEFGKQQAVIGFDINAERINELVQGFDRTREVSRQMLGETNIIITDKPEQLSQADFHIVTVPTPVNEAKQPDFSYLHSASKMLAGQLKPGDIVVYESTVYPGATEQECVPVLERESGLVAGKDFYVGYSPERINPGDSEHTFKNIIKVVAGDSLATLDIIAKVYESVVTAGVHRASSIKVAEAAKVIENTQRDLNIALMNELSLIFNKMDIDTRDVLAAASTKWNFLNFDPGLVGGHCIGVDPYYLTHKATILGYQPQVILSGRSINDGMGQFISDQLLKQLINAGGCVKGSIVTLLGFTFKENVSDIRNTRVIDIVQSLGEYGIQVQVLDPLASAEEVLTEYGIKLIEEQHLQAADAVILAVPHEYFINQGWTYVQSLLKDQAGVVLDVKAKLDRQAKPEAISLWRL